MKTTTALLLLVFLHQSVAYHLGFFVPKGYSGQGFEDNDYGESYPHALTIAIDDVNKDPTILPGHKLTYNYTDSTDSGDVLKAMYQRYISSPNGTVDAFIGPAFNCEAPAKVAEAFNIPMISYVSNTVAQFYRVSQKKNANANNSRHRLSVEFEYPRQS